MVLPIAAPITSKTKSASEKVLYDVKYCRTSIIAPKAVSIAIDFIIDKDLNPFISNKPSRVKALQSK
jgi:hypothetical protein